MRVQTSESSRPVDGPTDFALADGTTHIAIHWRGQSEVHVEAAFSQDGSTFGEFQHVELDEVGMAKEDGRTYGSIMVADGARAVRVTADQPIDEVTVLSLDAGSESNPLPGVGATASGVTGIPAVIPRAGWGADETIRFDPYGEERWLSQYFPLQKMIVHHTAGGNGDPNPAATVRAIYQYHAVTQDWGDIGYNYLIDSAGRIYEGRHSREYWYGASPTSDDASGLTIAGGHALYHNAGTMGIALLGDFTYVAPTTAARSALTSLLTWAADEHNIDPLGASTYVNPVSGVTRTVPNIAGHRDYNQTGCPGSFMWNLLPSIRAQVATAVNNWPGETFNPPRSVSLAAGTHTGYRFNSAGGVIGSLPFTLGSPSSAPASTRATIPNQGSGDWYRITAGIWAGYWLPASSAVQLGPPGGTVQVQSYRPYAPLQLPAGTFIGFRFDTWGNQTASKALTLAWPTWVPVTERSTIPGRGSTFYYYVTNGTLDGYWVPETAAMSVGTLPMANFVASQSSGIAPLSVTFWNTSITYGPT
ncbi:MAG TPA: N-acetylmuramoyl-L-alanine amidase, partial [Candidatus Limnocylindria bacterium]